MKSIRLASGGPMISVIIPVFNQAHTLARAVISVLKQSFSNWELIIVNDGSKDKTSVTGKELAKKDSRISFFNQPHRGVSATINFGVAHTRGKIITILAADDYYLPNHLENNFLFFKKHPQADLVASQAKIIGKKLVLDIEQSGRLIHLDKCVLGGTFFVKKVVFLAVGGRSELYQFGTDYHFFQAVKNKGFKVHRRRTRTYVYDRTGKNSITHQARKSL